VPKVDGHTLWVALVLHLQVFHLSVNRRTLRDNSLKDPIQ
jgi:hypothetical protein